MNGFLFKKEGVKLGETNGVEMSSYTNSTNKWRITENALTIWMNFLCGQLDENLKWSNELSFYREEEKPDLSDFSLWLNEKGKIEQRLQVSDFENALQDVVLNATARAFGSPLLNSESIGRFMTRTDQGGISLFERMPGLSILKMNPNVPESYKKDLEGSLVKMAESYGFDSGHLGMRGDGRTFRITLEGFDVVVKERLEGISKKDADLLLLPFAAYDSKPPEELLSKASREGMERARDVACAFGCKTSALFFVRLAGEPSEKNEKWIKTCRDGARKDGNTSSPRESQEFTEHKKRCESLLTGMHMEIAAEQAENKKRRRNKL